MAARLMAALSENPLICIAVVTGAFGVKGEVKIKSFTQNPEDCLAYGQWRGENGEVILSATEARPIKNGFAVYCEEVDTPEAAQALNGIKLYVYREELPEPDEEEFYFEDLVGLSVKTESGRRMGVVRAVHNYGAGDLLEIDASGATDKAGNVVKDFYHPFTKLAVPKVDLANKRLVIVIEETVSDRDDPDHPSRT